MPKKVIVLGGGIGGMSAAHELCERGFAVEVFELKDVPGGKARSIAVPNTGARLNVGTVHLGRRGGARRRDLPGEHGYRFFPGFYRHLVDTMRRIPYHGGSCADNLVQASRTRLARFGGPSIELPTRSPRSLVDAWALRAAISEVFDPDLGITGEEYDFFFERTWQILTSCEERRNDQYEKISWWDFIDADGRSEHYQKLFGLGGTQSLVAARAKLASTKTIGDAYLQYFLNIAGSGADRVLNGPTNDVWIQPWLDYLRSRGVQYHLRSRVRSINCARGGVRGVTIEHEGNVVDVVGDYYVSALPVDVMAGLITSDMIRLDPTLANIEPLSKNVGSQNGIQFFLTEDVPGNPGHVIYVDSPWALTSVSQKQFWPDVDLSQYGDGRVRGIISVDISDWNRPGLNGKTARECTREEIMAEVWYELKLSLNVEGVESIRDESLHSWFLDPDVDPITRANSEPLLVNLVDSWRLRPEAVTCIPNFFLASDYVRTSTDLACMEGANEAARRAVNGILQKASVEATPCLLWKPHEPAWLAPWRAHDRARYRRGLPWNDRLIQLALAAFSLIQRGADILEVGIEDALATIAQPEDLIPYLQSLLTWPDLLARLAREGQAPMADLAPSPTTSTATAPDLVPQTLAGRQFGELLRSLNALTATPPDPISGLRDGSQIDDLIRILNTLLTKPSRPSFRPGEDGQSAAITDSVLAKKSRVRFVTR